MFKFKIPFIIIITISVLLLIFQTNINETNINEIFNNLNIETQIYDNIEYVSIKSLCHEFWFNSNYDIKYDGYNQYSLYRKRNNVCLFKQFYFTEIYGDIYVEKEYFIDNLLLIINQK